MIELLAERRTMMAAIKWFDYKIVHFGQSALVKRIPVGVPKHWRTGEDAFVFLEPRT
jgi:hypothetical protein